MALRNLDKILELYNQSDTIQKDFSSPSSPVLNEGKLDTYYSSYNKDNINFRYRLPNNKSNSYVSTLARHLADDAVRFKNFYYLEFNNIKYGITQFR